MDLSIISVNWNSVDYLRECIRSIYDNTHDISFEIIVVDNASPEGGVEALKQEFPDIILIKSAENLGFAGANNLGFKHSSGEHILLLNPDIKLIGPAINLMFDQIQSLPDAGIVGCKLLNSDLSIQTSSIQTFPTILNQLLDIEYLRLRWPDCSLWKIGPLFSSSGKATKVEVITGACMMLKRDVFERAGLMSEDYFMYAEDLDLNCKVKRLGLSNYYLGAAQAIHYGGRSSSQQKVNQWATIMKYRAMMRFYRKNHGRLYGPAYRAAMGSAAAGRLIVLALVFPFGNREAIRNATAKWGTVLKWAIGMGN